MGKSAPPKHHCDCSNATRCCDIPISQIGCQFHYVPKTFVDMVFFPPAIPAWVLRHIKAHPLTWMWKLHAGTVLMVPMVPIHYPSNAHKAVRWIVSIFHLFKSSLHSSSLTPDGRVLPPLVRIYQNNMLIHIAGQQQLYDRLHPTQPEPEVTPPHPGKPPPSKTPLPPPPKQHTTCTAEIAALRAEIEALRKKMAELLKHQAPPSPCTILAMAPIPTQPPPPPLSTTSVRSCTAHPDHPWLQQVLDHKHCPPFIKSVDSGMAPRLRYTIPEDVQQVLQVQSSTFPPVYVGIDSNGDLQVAREADGNLVTISIVMPSGWAPL